LQEYCRFNSKRVYDEINQRNNKRLLTMKQTAN
jgi:hypothetical protein